jgi:hypothetical protein
MATHLHPHNPGDAQDQLLACFTKDMAETLLAFFPAYQRDNVVTLQLTDRGLWLVNPHDGSRQFLGQAVLSDAQRERLEVERARREHRRRAAN